jgi:sec-independent protein translocase protein TatA
MLGEGEIIVIVFVLVVVFSASRMSLLGNAIGKFVYSFKKASRGDDFVDVRPLPPRGSHGAKKTPEDAQLVDPHKR